MSDGQPTELKRVALVIQYLGTHFHGWQWQPRHRSVQAEIEQTLASVTGTAITLHGAGRTDAGVHAAAQVAHFDTQAPVPAPRWASILNARLPQDIAIRGSASVPLTWHARFSASWRRYRYTLYTDPRPNLFLRDQTWHYYYQPLSIETMQSALHPLLGRHHLAAFHRAGSSRPHSWVDIQSVSCVRHGSLVQIEVQASGFLYGMMRLLVGLLVQVGRGQRTPESFTQLWQQEQRDQVKYAAPPQGLCLLRVGYPEFPFEPEVWYDTLPTPTLAELPPNKSWAVALSGCC
ncbi:tRNA pseudouridine(38-40) synthase TruA [Synechococcales cyanobacterium C]|uniref:tRNA pseudouridine synthase A n=1 Tax=Petrachloros mirabilis ULC683 TaxID=2781853 RepID=A0A8K2A8H6_9CYAN|nr:tRNA pseudouridine(38-40) synthase TruA [Petrachloros mirabilis]NCJ08044.1 tRNA pseudouridine(38-40) synthase TruA [Petrachloros mirabilis ULC683]